MYDEISYDSRRRHLDFRVYHGLDHGPDAPDPWAVALAFLAAVFLILYLCGCSTPGDHYGTAPQVAAANARPGYFGGITDTAPAVVSGAVKSFSFLTGLGGVLLASGAFVLSQRDLSNGLGFGLLAAGLSLLLAGTLLPVYGGWIGLGALGALVAFYWRNHRARDPVNTAAPTITDRLKSLLN